MNKMYTKRFFQKFVELWETTSAEDMAMQLGVTQKQVNYVAAKIRKAGYALTRKRTAATFQSLLVESLDEINFPKA